MWDKSEKHLALGLLFVIAANPITSWAAIPVLICGAGHIIASVYYSFKEIKDE